MLYLLSTVDKNETVVKKRTGKTTTHTTVLFDLKLPDYVPQDQIGNHVKRLHRNLRTAGIGHLEVIGGSGETTCYEPIRCWK